VLTVGRRCRRGRPDEGVSLRFRRDGVPAMQVSPSARSSLGSTSRSVFPPLPVPGSSPSWCGATATSLLPGATPPPTARRGSGASAFFFNTGHAAEQREWKTPIGVVSLVSNPHRPLLLLNPRRGSPRGKERGRKGTDVRGPRGSDRDGERGAVRVIGPKGFLGWAAASQGAMNSAHSP
jgi:hypothetical protein